MRDSWQRWIGSALVVLGVLVIVLDKKDQAEATSKYTINLNRPITKEFSATGKGWRSTDAAGAEKMLEFPLRLGSDRTYRVTLDLGGVSGVLPEVFVDFEGAGYDNPEQEFRLSLSPKDSETRIVRDLPTGKVPSVPVHLRIFHYGPASLEVRSVSVERIGKGAALSQTWGAAGILLGLLLIGMTLRATARRWWSALVPTRDANGSRMFVDPVPWVLMLVVFAVIAAKAVPLGGPFVWDEAVYTIQSKFGFQLVERYPEAIFAEPVMTNHLFFWLYGWTHRFGDQYVMAARLLNALCYALAAVVMFNVARRYTGRLVAFAWASLGTVGATSSYAAAFMPEALYFLGFWLTISATVALVHRSPLSAAVAVGALLGLLALVKPHALMLLAAFGVFFALAPITVSRSVKIRVGLLSAAVCASAFWTVWVLGGGLLTGTWQAFGVGGYQSLTGQMTGLAGMMAVMPALMFSLTAHLGAWVLLLGVAIVGLFVFVLRTALRPVAEDDRFRTLAFLAAIIGVVLVVLIAKYSAHVSETDRLHARYYNFMFPLLVLPFLVAPERLRQPGKMARALLACLGVLLVIGAAFLLDGRFGEDYTDFPEGMLLSIRSTLPWVAGLSILGFASMLFSARAHYRITAAILATMAVGAGLHAWRAQAARPMEPAMFAGRLLRESDPGGDPARWQVLGETLNAPFAWAAIGIREPVSFAIRKDPRVASCDEILPKTDWLLMLGPGSIDCGFANRYAADQFSLWRRKP